MHDNVTLGFCHERCSNLLKKPRTLNQINKIYFFFIVSDQNIPVVTFFPFRPKYIAVDRCEFLVVAIIYNSHSNTKYFMVFLYTFVIN